MKKLENKEKDDAEFIGWYFGDGCLSSNLRYKEFALTGDLREELEFYQKIIIPYLKTKFGHMLKQPIKLRRYMSTGVCGFYTFDRDFVDFISREHEIVFGRKKNKRIPKWISRGGNDLKIAFLRGLFDTDGSIFFCKGNKDSNSILSKFHYKPKIKIATISKNLMLQTYSILKELGFTPIWRTPKKQRDHENIIYSITIHRKKDIIKWLSQVGFKNSKHNTKVLLWKKFGFCPPYTKIKERRKLLINGEEIKKYYNISLPFKSSVFTTKY